MNRFSVDECNHSISFLKQLCLKQCESFDIQNPIFTDSNDYFLKPHREKNDIFLFGSYMTKLLHSHYWKGDKYRLWVLSRSVKKVLTDVFSIPQEYINIVPISKNKGSNNYNGELFIYAGRLSAEKNIDYLVLTFKHLLKKLPNARLTLQGVFSNENMPGRRQFNYEDYIRKLITSHNLDNNISILPFDNDSNWYEKYKDAHYISLSTSFKEDFSVSTYQFLSSNGKIILSNWGGHKEFNGNSVIKLDMPNNLFQEMNSIEHNSYLLADVIYSKLKDSTDNQKAFETQKVQNKYIDIEQLNFKVKSFVNSMGEMAHLLLHEKDFEFYYSNKGRFLFYKLNNIFGATSSNLNIISTNKIFNTTNKIPKNAPLVFLPESELVHPHEIKRLLAFRKINIYTDDGDRIKKIVSKIPILNHNIEVHSL